MDNRICYIFAAGDFCGKLKKNNNDIVIAADAGFHHLEKAGLAPDILLGDFDTIGEVPVGFETVTYPCEKNYTDTELAINEGINRGYSRFIICGAVGGKRLEHTIANLKLASSYASKGYDITLTDGDYIIKALHNGSLNFDCDEKGFISFFALDGIVEGLTIDGLKYPLCNATLNETTPTLCVSNEFIGEKASVKVENGTIIIVYQGKEFK